ncbi:hypothetical protein EDC04DRAFT_2606429 [Pisolithus marmoratus]|nr:hypothetical protein EDC04DRAFT_2606429 [Pisolithus marmoratus]
MPGAEDTLQSSYIFVILLHAVIMGLTGIQRTMQYKIMDHINYILNLVHTANDSKSLKGKRIFYSSKTDYDGPACLPNPAMTWVKRQVGGGGKATDRMASEDEHSCLSPLPAPRTLCSTSHKGVAREMNSLVKVRDSSGHDATNVGDEDKGDAEDYGKLFLLDDEQAPSTHKCKAKSQQSLHPTNRVASLLNNSMQLPNPNIVKMSSQTRLVMKKRIQACGNAAELFVSDDEPTHKCKEKPQGSSRSTKQLASSLEMDRTRLSGPKVMKTLSQTRPVIKKPRLCFISPLSSKLSSKEELESQPPGDQLNVTLPMVSVKHQQSSGELHIEQCLQTVPSPSQEDQLLSPSHESCHNGLPNLPSHEAPCNEVVMQTEWTVSHLKEDEQLPSGSYQEPWLEAAQLEVPPPHILGGQPIAGHPLHEPAGNQVTGAPHQEPPCGLL